MWLESCSGCICEAFCSSTAHGLCGWSLKQFSGNFWFSMRTRSSQKIGLGFILNPAEAAHGQPQQPDPFSGNFLFLTKTRSSWKITPGINLKPTVAVSDCAWPLWTSEWLWTWLKQGSWVAPVCPKPLDLIIHVFWHPQGAVWEQTRMDNEGPSVLQFELQGCYLVPQIWFMAYLQEKLATTYCRKMFCIAKCLKSWESAYFVSHFPYGLSEGVLCFVMLCPYLCPVIFFGPFENCRELCLLHAPW